MSKLRHKTMCIVHKGFRGFRALSPALILGGKLIGLKPAIPYDTIHSPLCLIFRKTEKMKKIIFLAILIFVAVKSFSQEEVFFTKEELKSDLDRLKVLIERIHPEPYFKYERNKFYSDIDSIKNKLDKNISKHAFYLIITEIISKFSDTHTEVFSPKKNREDYCPFPLSVSLVEDKFYIKESKSINKEYIGWQFISIDGVRIDSIFEFMKEHLPSASINHKEAMIEKFFPPIYEDLVGVKKSYKFSVKKGKQTNSFTLYKRDLDLDVNLLPNIRKTYSLEYLNENAALFTIPSFLSVRNFKLDTIFSDLKNKEIKNLIIDVRNNKGGFSWNVDSLMSYLTDKKYRLYDKVVIKKSIYNKKIAENAREELGGKDRGDFIDIYFKEVVKPHQKSNKFTGNIYVLTSSYTASAATLFSNVIKYNDIGTLIGQETGEHTIMFANPIKVELPNSKIELNIASEKAYYFNAKKSVAVKPDYLVKEKLEDYFLGKDTEINYVLKMIE